MSDTIDIARWEQRASEIAQLYYRAVWASDYADNAEARKTRIYIGAVRHRLAVVMNMPAQSAKHAVELEKALDQLYEWLLKHLHELLALERNPNRPEHEKIVTFLVGTAKRVRRAMRLGDPNHLNFYDASNEMFHGQVDPRFQVARSLWHGVREELKMGIACSVIREQLHPQVEHLVDAFRRCVFALEENAPSALKYYTRSPLALSVEQEGRRLWEGVRHELHKAYEMVERRAA